MPGIHASPLYAPGNPSGVVGINDVSVSGTDFSGYRLESDGTITYRTSGGGGYTTVAGAWISPQIGMADYEAFATLSEKGDGGNMSGSNFDEWLSLASDRYWQIGSIPFGDFSYAFLEISIRKASDPGTILDTATIHLNVSG